MTKLLTSIISMKHPFKMTRTLMTAALGFLTVTALTTLAAAQEPKLVAEHKDWMSYMGTANGAKACFAVSQPTKYSPLSRGQDPEDRHGQVFFYLTSRPAQNVSAEPSIKVGFNFRDESAVTADVDGKTYAFFTKGDRAWIENVADVGGFVGALKAGRTLKVSGTSSRGTKVAYTFSLSGVTAAVNQLSSACK